MKNHVVTFGRLLSEKPHVVDHVPDALKTDGIICELAKLIGLDMELIWCQKSIIFSYRAFLYFPLLIDQVSNEKCKEKLVSFKNHYLIRGNYHKIDQKVVQVLEHVYYNEKCKQYVETRDWAGHFQHEIVRNIRKTTSFNLFYIDFQHITTNDFTDFDSWEIEPQNVPVPQASILHFNKWINDLVMKCHKSGVLEFDFAKESLLNLLLYLISDNYAPHQLTFYHSDIESSCPHQRAHIGIAEDFENLIQSEKFSHVYKCFVKKELHHRGATDGEEILSTCYLGFPFCLMGI